MISSGKASSSDFYEILNLPTEKIDKLYNFLTKAAPTQKRKSKAKK